MSSPNGLAVRALLLATAVALPFARTSAEAPQVKVQVPGYYRVKVGEAEITALYDGFVELDWAVLKNVSPAEVQRLVARMFAATPKMHGPVNAYLVNTGGRLVLVDAGSGKLFGPTAGNLLANLRASGYEPAQVDVVLVTHLHPDHFGGLVDAEGRPAFANALVRVPRADADFWLSEETAARQPENMRPFVEMARHAAGVLGAAGKWGTFSWGDEVAPGFKAVQADGHTPGHTAYQLDSSGQRLLLWGDLVHNAWVQFTRPSATFEFDSDARRAAATRKQLLARTAREGALVAGSHLPFPGLGHVRAEGAGSYAWVPVEYEPLH